MGAVLGKARAVCVTHQTGKAKSEVVRELLAEYLRSYRLRLASWLTEDDILQDVS